MNRRDIMMKLKIWGAIAAALIVVLLGCAEDKNILKTPPIPGFGYCGELEARKLSGPVVLEQQIRVELTFSDYRYWCKFYLTDPDMPEKVIACSGTGSYSWNTDRQTVTMSWISTIDRCDTAPILDGVFSYRRFGDSLVLTEIDPPDFLSFELKTNRCN